MRLQYEDDPASRVLYSISNPVRRSIIQALASKRRPVVFSLLMKECGLNPNFDAGLFSYHLSVLMSQNVVNKTENKYGLTELGFILSRIVKTIDKECEFFLKEENRTENEVIDSEVKWAKKKDWAKYGITTDLKEAIQRQKLPGDEEEKMWKFRFNGEYIVALRNEETLGWMRVLPQLGADLKKKLILTPIRNIATISDITLLVTGKERVHVAKKMIETFLTEAGKKGATSVTTDINAEDEDLLSTFKSFGFERTGIIYEMSKKI